MSTQSNIPLSSDKSQLNKIGYRSAEDWPGALSTAHIGPLPSGTGPAVDHSKEPHTTFWLGAGLVAAKVPTNYQQKGGGQRGNISKFSRASRLRLMRKVARTKIAELPLFVTLTYGEAYPDDPKVWKAEFKAFWKRVKRKFPKAGCIWKLEPQKRGAPHWHLLLWGVPLLVARANIPYMWASLVGRGDTKVLNFHLGLYGNQPCVTPVRSYKGVMAYASKYLGKELEVAGWTAPGRFWGVLCPSWIPWGELIKIEDMPRNVYKFMRYMRKYAKLKGRHYTSLQVFALSDSWFDVYDRLIGA